VPAKGFREPLPAWLVEVHRGPPRRPHTAFVDRTVPAERLTHLLRGRAATASSGLLAVMGEAGVGKSRLVGEVAGRLGPEWTVLTVACPRHDDLGGLLPVYRLLAALPEAGAGRQAAGPGAGRQAAAPTVIRVAGAVGGRASASERVVAQSRADLHRAVVDGLARTRGDGRLLVVLEDCHFMSTPLATLVADLAATPRLAGSTVLLVGRAVPAGLAPDDVLTVDPLAAPDATVLAGSLLGDAVELHAAGPPEGLRADPASIATVTSGNPLFIEQLVQLLRIGGADGPAPPSAHAAIGARVDGLGAAAQALLALLAVLGEPIPAGDLDAVVADPDPSGAVAELLGANLLDGDAARDGRLTLLSPLVGDVVVRRLTRVQRHRLHHTIAGYLGRLLAFRPAAVELLAHHRHQAYLLARDDFHTAPADVEAAAGAAVRAWCGAARFAISRGEVAVALRATGFARGAAGPDAGLLSTVDAVEAYAHGHAGDVQAALACARAAGAAGLPAVRVHAALHELFLQPHLPVPSTLPAIAEVLALARSSGDPEALAGAHLYAGVLGLRDGDHVRAHAWLAKALTAADRAGYCVVTPEIYAHLGLAAVLGDTPVRETVRVCTDLFRRSAGSRLLRAVGATTLALAWHQAGRIAAADRALGRARSAFAEVGHPAGEARLCEFAAVLAARTGRWSHAAAGLREQAQRYADLGMVAPARWSRLNAVVAAVADIGPAGWDPVDGATHDLPSPDGWEESLLPLVAGCARAVAHDDHGALATGVAAVLARLGAGRGAGARTVPLLTVLALAAHLPRAGLVPELVARVRTTLAVKGDRGVSVAPW
jgi:hypothetical protein